MNTKNQINMVQFSSKLELLIDELPNKLQYKVLYRDDIKGFIN